MGDLKSDMTVLEIANNPRGVKLGKISRQLSSSDYRLLKFSLKMKNLFFLYNTTWRLTD